MARDAHQGSKEDGRERGVQLDIAEDRPAGHAAGPHRLAALPPLPYDDVAGELLPIAGWWIALHTIVFGLVPFMGVALWMLTAGLRGVFATLSRVAAVVFALFYDAGTP